MVTTFYFLYKVYKENDFLIIEVIKDYPYCLRPIHRENAKRIFRLKKTKENYSFDGIKSQLDSEDLGFDYKIIKQKDKTQLIFIDEWDKSAILEAETIEEKSSEYTSADLWEYIADKEKGETEERQRAAKIEKKVRTAIEECERLIERAKLKQKQADWLSESKKGYLEGYLEALAKILVMLKNKNENS